MPNETVVSVIMPVRNGASYIGEALHSVLAELDAKDEIIVVDDGSTDSTDEVVRGVAPYARHFAVPNLGVSAARNVGLRAARGNFIAFLDHDDLWPPGSHRALRALLASTPSADAAAGRLHVRVEPGGTAGQIAELDGKYAPSMLSSCLYRRNLTDKVGLFDERLRYGEDVDYHLRLVEAGMRLVLSECEALIYRRHARNTTNAAPPRHIVLMHILARRARRHRASIAASSAARPS